MDEIILARSAQRFDFFIKSFWKSFHASSAWGGDKPSNRQISYRY